MDRSESIAALAAALAKAQAQIAPAKADSVNPHFRSHYADLASIVDACRPALTANGLAVVQSPCSDPALPDHVGLETMLLHSSGEFIVGRTFCKAAKSDPQGYGSTLTYLRRYSMAAMIGVTATADDDGNAASAPPQHRPTSFAQAVVRRIAEPPPKGALAPAPALKMSDDHAVDTWTGIVAYVKRDSGTSATGKPWTKWRVGWTLDDGEKVYATTFSSTDGECAERSKADKVPVRIRTTVGERGVDIQSIEEAQQQSAVAQMGGEDEIPF